MKLVRPLHALLAGLVVSLPVAAWAQQARDAALASYVGVALGTGKVSLNCPANTTCSPVDTGATLRFGHQLDSAWAIELSYADISADFSFLVQEYSASFKGYGLGAAYTLPISGTVSALLRGGVSANQVRFRAATGFGTPPAEPLSTRSVKPYVGLGASWQFARRWSANVNADWFRADLRETTGGAKQSVNVRMLGGDLSFHF